MIKSKTSATKITTTTPFLERFETMRTIARRGDHDSGAVEELHKAQEHRLDAMLSEENGKP